MVGKFIFWWSTRVIELKHYNEKHYILISASIAYFPNNEQPTTFFLLPEITYIVTGSNFVPFLVICTPV